MNRKLIIRILVFGLLFIPAAAAYWYRAWTNPAVVRDLVLLQLNRNLPNVEVSLSGAEFQLLGGVRLKNLRCSLESDPREGCFADLPETVIYPDKELLARGRLAARKIVVRRPSLTLVRQADGRFTLQDLTLPQAADSGLPLPLIEIEQATLDLRDFACAGPPLRIVNGCFEFHPSGNQGYRMKGRAEIDLLGVCELEGRLDLHAHAAELRLSFPAIALTDPLFELVSRYWPDWDTLQVQASGLLSLQIDVTASSQPGESASIRVAGQITRGEFRHPDLPDAVSDVAGAFSAVGQMLTVERLTGRFQDGAFELSGHAATSGDVVAHIQARQWRVDASVYEKLPPAVRRLCLEYQPDGRLSGRGTITLLDGRLGLEYLVHPERLSILFEDLPYPVSDVKGTIAYHEPNGEPHMTMHLTGKASGQPVMLRGRLFGAGLRPDNDYKCGFELDLAGDGIPLDKTLEAGLSPYPFTARTLAMFHASGRFNCRAKLMRAAGTIPGQRAPLQKMIVAQVEDAQFKFDEFPYPLREGKGTLTIFSDDSWKFENFSATRLGGMVSGRGTMTPTVQGDRLHIELRAANVPLDKELREAVPLEAREAWDELRPAGRIDAEAVLDGLIGHGPLELDLTLRPRRCSIRPIFFPYLLEQVEGQVRYRNNLVSMERMTARHRGTHLRLQEGTIAIGPNGAIRAKLLPIQAQGLVVDSELIEAVPRLMGSTLETLKPDQPIHLLANLILETDGRYLPWRCGWNGYVDLRNCRIQAGLELERVTGRIALRGEHDGRRMRAWGRAELAHLAVLRQPLEQLAVDMAITEDEIRLTGLSSRLQGGTLDGDVEVKLHDPIAYNTRINIENADLGALAQSATGKSSSVAGRLSAGLKLQGRGQEVGSLRGNGWLRVEKGERLCELPVILEIVNHFSRVLPRATSFQDATATVEVEGRNLAVSRFDLLSDAMSLRGHGQVDVYGEGLNLEMFGMPYGRTLPNLPPILDRIPPTISKQLLRIRATGSLTDVQVATEPLPLMFDPIKDMVKTFGEKPEQPAAPDFDTRR